MRTRPLLAYLVLAYAWTWVMVLPLLLGRRGITPMLVPPEWEAVGAFGPFVAAALVVGRLGPAERAAFRASLFRFDVPGRWLAAGLLSPFFFLAGALVIVALGPGLPDASAVLARESLATARGLFDLLIISAVLQALGEEPGWRGFLLPKLRTRFGPLAASLVLFPAWLLWHLPFFLARPDFGLAQFAGFSMGILSASMWMTWLWDATRSSGIAVAWHALLNITRGLALAVSTQAFLAYGGVVLAGAVLIVLWWVVRGSRAPGLSPGWRGTPG